MTAQPMKISAFASKLTALKQARFSGRLFLKGTLGQEWTLYFYLGRILYATGGTHPVRRWQRHLGAHCSNVNLNQLHLNLPSNISETSSEVSKNHREYYLLCLWLKQQQITREQVVKIIQGIVLEVLFDISQEIPKALQIKQENPLAPQLLLIDAEQAIAKTQEIWQAWKIAKISDLLPNRAPSIKQPEQLQQKTSPTVYKSLTLLLNGQRTLRDIAVQTKRNVAEVARSLLPYIETGLVELNDIPDLADPVAQASSELPVKNSPASSGKTPAQVAARKPLIACVDDSPLVCKNMEKILTSAGYQFLAVSDSMRAIATLLNRKPHIIFLDLVMPNTNGYEICTQLRKVSAFRDTPIIILTGNDGIIDRVRAKVVGASDFMGKPVDAEKVLAITNKYLKHLKNSSLVVS
ncbi:response regulator [Coleofasciculus sp. FACHB-1120]|uniref:response regulator n=1 Tax=Coleofasciculus sp. FACHB-1120 TaxID=2692783 RepID=UPI00168A3417|nr:response regulator [Coleofasciculus sp. FACHB-1120]MBD2742663.1 response regulator [Coleofasciculus sp. FACHB-1120]